MTKQLIIPKEIVTVNSKDEILRNHFIEIVDGKISRIDEVKNFIPEDYDGEVVILTKAQHKLEQDVIEAGDRLMRALKHPDGWEKFVDGGVLRGYAVFG